MRDVIEALFFFLVVSWSAFVSFIVIIAGLTYYDCNAYSKMTGLQTHNTMTTCYVADRDGEVLTYGEYKLKHFSSQRDVDVNGEIIIKGESNE